MQPQLSLRWVMALTDFGFILYWSLSGLAALGAIDLPSSWLYKDYDDPQMVTWNWSFAPLDLLASFTGLAALWRARRGQPWVALALVSASLTFCAGFMALSFWAIAGNFDPSWWAANAFLMTWPILFTPSLMRAVKN